MKEHDETRSNGAQAKIYPIARMALLWGPFLIFPFWVGRFILFPVALASIVYTMVAGLGLIMLESMGFMNFPTTELGFLLWSFWGVLFSVVCLTAFMFCVFLFGKGIEFVIDGFRSLQTQKTKTSEAEMRATPVIGAWLKGLHDKFCPTATIVVEAEA